MKSVLNWLGRTSGSRKGGSKPASSSQPGSGSHRHPSNWNLPAWVASGYEKDEMAWMCSGVQGWPFLATGVPPCVGQRLYMQVEYEHDGSHPAYYRGWARMVGHITEVLPPPPAGVYGQYINQEVELSEGELSNLRSQLPELPPSFVQRCKCAGTPHPMEYALENFGAVHGQRLQAKLRLSCDDEGCLEPQLAGEWDIELICDDTRENVWCLCKMTHAGPTRQTLPEAYPPGSSASKCWIPQPDGSISEEYPAPPLRTEKCAHCGAVGAVKKRGGVSSAEVVPLLRCGGCKAVCYCSVECQKAAWPQHREECDRLKASTAGEE